MRDVSLALLLLIAAGAAGAATIEVNSTADVVADDGRCTLREAILAANGDAASGAFDGECAAGSGPDVIAFAIPRDGPHVIAPNPRLPDVESEVLIDGLTQPGADCHEGLRIEIRGDAIVEAEGYGPGLNLVSGSAGSTVRGLAVNGFDVGGGGVGLALSFTSGVRVQCNYLGTDASGTVARPNMTSGVYLSNNADDNWIGVDGDGVGDANEGNVLSGNGGDGVTIASSSEGNVVAGNLIGLDRTGKFALPNKRGVRLFPASVVDDTRVGSDFDGVSDALEANLIAHSLYDGIQTGDGQRNSFRGNRIWGSGEEDVDLDDDGPTANDPDDFDEGGNRRQNHPEIVLAAVLQKPLRIQVDFLVDTDPLAADYPLTVDFFTASGLFLGTATVDEGDFGTGPVREAFPLVSGGSTLVGMSTDALGNSSELSPPLALPVVFVDGFESGDVMAWSAGG